MYAIYTRKKEGNEPRLIFDHEISLAGCNVGIIPNLLKEKLTPQDNAPSAWILPITNHYNQLDQVIIIDIKPNNENENVICELDTVFGFSYEEWSPVMFRLRQLYNEEIGELTFNKKSFIYPKDTETIYTMSYLTGSFQQGELSGKWIYPGKSSTNSVLLWPEAISFFYEQINKFDPGFLNWPYGKIRSPG